MLPQNVPLLAALLVVTPRRQQGNVIGIEAQVRTNEPGCDWPDSAHALLEVFERAKGPFFSGGDDGPCPGRADARQGQQLTE